LSLSAAARMNATPDAVGFVLAGGESRRMGRDKALVEFAGRPLIAHALSILEGAGLPAAIAGARSALGAFAPVIEDRESGLGPLSGISAALESTQARRAIFLSVDQPLLPSSLLQCLLRHARITGRAVTVASVTGFAQTFPAVLDCAVLPVLRSELGGGRRGCFRAFEAAAARLEQPLSIVAVELIAQAGQAEHPQGINAASWLLNVNSPGDLARAAELSASDIA